MKVLWFGSYNPEYPRNEVLLEGLRLMNVEVVECNSKSTGVRRYVDMIKTIRSHKNKYDLVYCAFPAWYATLLAYVFQSKPLVTDAFYPAYDAFVVDRNKVSKFYPYAWWLRVLDFLNARLPNSIVVDTIEHKKYWERLAPKQTIAVVPVGAATETYHPQPDCTQNPERVTVTFYGSHIPLQGAEKLVAVAELLKEAPEITLQIIGPESLHNALQELGAVNLHNLKLLPWQSQSDLNILLNKSDIVLGIFGDTPKASRVIPNKVFQGLAVNKLVITKDTPAVRELFTDEHLALVKSNPADIAQAIKEYLSNQMLRHAISQAGHTRFLEIGTPEKLGRALATILQSAVLAHRKNRK